MACTIPCSAVWKNKFVYCVYTRAVRWKATNISIQYRTPLPFHSTMKTLFSFSFWFIHWPEWALSSRRKGIDSFSVYFHWQGCADAMGDLVARASDSDSIHPLLCMALPGLCSITVLLKAGYQRHYGRLSNTIDSHLMKGAQGKKNKYKKRISTSSDMAIVLFFFIAIRAVVPIVLICENHQVIGEIVR